VQVIATVTNKGGSRGQAAVKLSINGVEQESRSVTLDAGSSVSMAYTVIRNEPGEYAVHVSNIPAGSFTVQSDPLPDVILVVSAAMVSASLILACVYIWRRRQQGY
jgi:hypothetical protein